MANATARVAKAIVNWPLRFFKRSTETLSAETTFYTQAMVGTDATGYYCKGDDTQAWVFAGLVRGREGNPVVPAGTAGDAALDLDVERPAAFELAVASVAVTDIGRLVYAIDDQTGTLDPSTRTYANVVGKVIDRAASGIALVEPLYGLPATAVPGAIQSLGASGAVVIKPSTVFVTKAGVAALTIVDPTTGVHDGLEMTFISTTAQAHTLSNAAGTGFNAGGASTDVGTFGGAKGDNITIVAYAGVWLVKSKTNVTLG